MPYSSASDPSLPKDVRRASQKRRRRFVSAFNSAIREDPDEGRAFRIARAAMDRKRADARRDLPASLGGKRVTRSDGCVGLLKDALGGGYGGLEDWTPRPKLPRDVIDDLYVKSLFVQKIVDGLVRDVIEVAPVLTSDLVDGAAVADAMSRFNATSEHGALAKAFSYSRKDGGGAALAILEDGLDPSEPVDLSRISRVRGFVALSAWELTVTDWDLTAGTAWYGERFNRPLLYQASPSSGAATAISGKWHRSRVIPFVHLDLERRLAQRYRGWGPGVIEGMFPELVSRFGGVRRVGDLLKSYGYDHLEVGELDAKLLAENGADHFKAMLDDLRAQRDAPGAGVGVIATNPGTSMKPLARSAANVDQLTEVQRSYVLDAYEGPAIELFGRSNAGLSGDDMEGEWKVWRRVVKAARRGRFWPRYRQMAILLMAAKDGPTGGQIDYDLSAGGPGWEPDEAQSDSDRADARKKDAEARKLDVETLGLTPEELRASDPTVEKAYPDMELRTAGPTGSLQPMPAEPNVVGAPEPAPERDPGKPTAPDDLVTEPALRELYSFGAGTFKNMIASKEVTNYGLPNRRRYSLSEVVTALAKRNADSLSAPPRTFTMIRRGDVHGVSGTGEVMDGVLWPNGRVTTRWMVQDKPTTETSFDSYLDFLAIHVLGHEGNGTEIVFHDRGAPPVDVAEASTDREARADAEAWLRLRTDDADDADEDRILEARKKFNRVVNMSASRLREWSETECSKAASLSRAPIERVLRLLDLPADEWTLRDATQAMRVVSFVSRMLGNARGEPAKKGCPSKRDISLRNWGHWPS